MKTHWIIIHSSSIYASEYHMFKKIAYSELKIIIKSVDDNLNNSYNTNQNPRFELYDSTKNGSRGHISTVTI